MGSFNASPLLLLLVTGVGAAGLQGRARANAVGGTAPGDGWEVSGSPAAVPGMIRLCHVISLSAVPLLLKVLVFMSRNVSAFPVKNINFSYFGSFIKPFIK